MLGKIKRLVEENRTRQKKIIELINVNNSLLKELDWANIYHDSIRGIDWLEKLPLNIGRWAGNYTFFYLLNRVLKDFQPKSILEFGLGESSKYISSYLENELLETKHDIFEHDVQWHKKFKQKFNLSDRSNVSILPLIEKDIHGFKVNSYKNIDDFLNEKYDLYLVDGPIGSSNYSRYDIVNIVKKFTIEDEFLIIMDDYERIGEQETTNVLIDILKNKKVAYFSKVYEGNQKVCIIGTDKYKSSISF